MAKNKNTKDEVSQDIMVYEINERYGITEDGIVYDMETESPLVPILDDIGRPCVKINRKRIPIDELRRKYIPDPIRDEVIANKPAKTNKIKINGICYESIEEASIKLKINKNVIHAYLMKGGK